MLYVPAHRPEMLSKPASIPADFFVVDLEELKTLAQSRVTRVLTTAECQQYLHAETCPGEE